MNRKIRCGVVAFLAVLIFWGAAGCRRPREHNGIILIVLDSLREDHLSHNGYRRPTSPFLDGLMKRGVLFKNAYAAGPQTSPSVSSLLTGLYPYRHGSHFFSANQSYHPTRSAAEGGLPLMQEKNQLLAEYLKAKGFETATVTANPTTRDLYGFAQGVDHYRYIDCFAEGPQGLCNGMDLNRILDEDILPKIKGCDFFLFLHYMDVHYPYYKPHAFQGRFLPDRGEPFYLNGLAPELSAGDLEYSQACYDEGIVYQDKVLSDLFDRLQKAGVLDRTLIVVVSDHGDEFLEHGGLGHGTTCYNELIRSFILFFHPQLEARAYDLPVSLVDVLPTLLDWAGAGPAKDADGLSLWPLLSRGDESSLRKPRMFFSELGDRKALLDGSSKFIYNFDTKKAELYDLKTDPQERRNLSREKPEETVRYETELRTLFRKMAVSYIERKLDRREEQNLRSLSYIR